MTLWRRIYEERKRVILPVALAVLANIATLLLGVLPLQHSVTRAQGASADAKMALASARLLERRAKEQRASNDRAVQELTKFYQEKLPRDFPTATVTTNRYVEVAARDAGLRFEASHYDAKEIRESRLSRATSKVTLTGSYASIRKFLYALETAEEFIVVEKVELEQPGDSPALAGKLAVTLTVSTYFLTS